jgi:hypothetical protein
MKEQNYSNHARYFPFLHFFVMPLALVLLFLQAYRGLSSMDNTELIILGLVFLLICSNVAARLQALKAQDRVIRLEEFLRFDSLLSPEVAAKAKKLPPSVIMGLRFAPDHELTNLLERVFSGELTGSKEIKQAIKDWKADHHRV